MRALCILLSLLFFFTDIAKAAPSPQERAQAALRAMEGLALRQAEADPLDQLALERQLKDFAREFRSIGPSADPALISYLEDKSRPRKIRSYSVVFLGMLQDPAAWPALKDCVADRREDVGLRALCLQSAGALRIDIRPRRSLAEEWAFSAKAPESLVREALGILAETGSADTEKLEKSARKYGSSPVGLRELFARNAVAALAASRGPSEAALLRLALYFRKGSTLRSDSLTALRIRKPKSADLPEDAVELLTPILLRDIGRPSLETARLFGEFGDPKTLRALLEALKIKDPSTIAEAAQALQRLGDPAAAAPLARLSEGLISDKRFSPRPGLDTRDLAARIQKAAEFFLEAKNEAKEASQSAPAPASASFAPFHYEGWPGAQAPMPVWNGRAQILTLHKEPSSDSPSSSSQPQSRRSLPVLSSLVVLKDPGTLRARRDLSVGLRDLGPDRPLKASDYGSPVLRMRLPLKEGQTLEILAYRPEGACFLRSERRLYLGECLTEAADKDFSVLAEPKVEWWLKTRTGTAEGWFSSDEIGVDF
ncbi:MAG: HEAT repeat domain-containing protein [Elusimicrobiota bacterium]|jgi:HEAT repeat protein